MIVLLETLKKMSHRHLSKYGRIMYQSQAGESRLRFQIAAILPFLFVSGNIFTDIYSSKLEESMLSFLKFYFIIFKIFFMEF